MCLARWRKTRKITQQTLFTAVFRLQNSWSIQLSTISNKNYISEINYKFEASMSRRTCIKMKVKINRKKERKEIESKGNMPNREKSEYVYFSVRM